MGEQQKLDSHEWTKDKREELVCQQITTIKPRQEVTGKTSKPEGVKNLARHSFIRKIVVRNTYASKLNHFASAVSFLVSHLQEIIV
jgi:predicted sulfurtransferase